MVKPNKLSFQPGGWPARKALFVLIVLILGFYLLLNWWLLLTMNVSDPYEHLLSYGWHRINPLTPSMLYRNNGSFNVSFTNDLGTTIKLEEITFKEAISGAPCHSVVSTPPVYTSVKAGEIFSIAAICPQKKDGEPYDLVITFKYNSTMSGNTTTYNDTGHIKGFAEALDS